MAIARMEKLSLIFKAEHLDRILHLMQGFQGIHIETGYESTIPPSRKSEVDKDIREAEKNLQDIQDARGILKERESSNILKMLKDSGEKQLTITQLTKIVEESNWKEILGDVIQTDRSLQDNRTRRQEVTRLLNELEIWEYLNYNPLEFAKLNRSTAVFGSVHIKHHEEFSDILAKYEVDGIHHEKVTENNDRTYFFIIYHNSMNEKLSAFMNEFSFSIEEYRFDKPQREAKHELEEEEGELLKEEKLINNQIIEQAKYNEILTFAEDYKLNILLRKKKSLEVTYDDENIEINGWIISQRLSRFEKLISKCIPAADYRLFVSPIRDKDIDDVPIKLENNKLVTVYERLTEMYSMPKYNEIDPTPVMTIFYLIFFGMMVADVGYGLAIFLIGFLIKRFLNIKRSAKSFIDFLFYLSFPIMGWGLIYGSFCGIELPFGLISTRVDIIPMIILSIILGFLHIMAGLVMHMLNQIKVKNYYYMLTGGLAWFLIFLGGGLMILTGFVPWFDTDGKVLSDILTWTGMGMLILGLGMVIIVPAIEYGKRWYAGIGKGLYALYGATGYIGDFISYTRLMALGVAGGSVALAFNTILDYLPLPVRLSLGIVLAIILHALNIFLSMLSAYVHGIRLQFVEFFGKFYAGGGKKFEPFKAAEKNIIITDEGEGGQ